EALPIAEALGAGALGRVSTNQALLYQITGRYQDAMAACARLESTVQAGSVEAGRALRLRGEIEGALGHPRKSERLLKQSIALHNLGVLYKAMGRLAEARPTLERALAVFEKSLGRAHPQTCDCLRNLARLTTAESRALMARARRLEAEFRDVSRPANPIDHEV